MSRLHNCLGSFRSAPQVEAMGQFGHFTTKMGPKIGPIFRPVALTGLARAGSLCLRGLRCGLRLGLGCSAHLPQLPWQLGFRTETILCKSLPNLRRHQTMSDVQQPVAPWQSELHEETVPARRSSGSWQWWRHTAADRAMKVGTRDGANRSWAVKGARDATTSAKPLQPTRPRRK